MPWVGRRASLLAWFGVAATGFAACVAGGADDGGEIGGSTVSDTGVESATDAGLYPDVRPGTIFDATDDAPCAPGSTAKCKTTCGTIGLVTCVSGEWGACKAVGGDPCKGIDCTGKGDGLEHSWFQDKDGDGHGDAKNTQQACVAPSGWVSSSDDCDDGQPSVHPGAAEICDRLDNDCNGKVDEGQHVGVFDLLFSAVPPCDPADHASCKQGAAAWCKARSSCYDGGYGPVELGVSNGFFVCISGGTALSGFSDVVAAQPGCSSDTLAGQRVCESAVHRAGAAKGFASAILQTHAPSSWTYLGLPNDRVQVFAGVSWTEITAKHAGCTITSVDAWDCNAAVHRWCTAKGFPSGYGPIEYNPSELAVACVKG
ncbi:MAG: putative metal-binding motif-containing protein [Myxococcales bacterium]|nr:putative metal-binding motif-containing protein [Myxococcales bacterium]